MRIPLDPDSATPLYKQVKDYLREQITSGSLAPDTKLPASRALAESLGLNRITVTNAYADLEIEGLLYSVRGSGTYVARQRPAAIADNAGARQDWPLWQQEAFSNSWAGRAQSDVDMKLPPIEHPDLIGLAEGRGAGDLFPVEEFRKAWNLMTQRDGAEAFTYGSRTGYPPLREAVAQLLTGEGIPAQADQVLITTGAQEALAVAAMTLLKPGDLVAVENPTFFSALFLFRSLGLRTVSIPVDDEGMLVDRLEDVVQKARPKLIYTQPTFSNPTGVSMSAARRRHLVTLAERYNVPILEDDCFSVLRYEDKMPPSLKALDHAGNVIHVGSFSKVLSTGLRIGYLAVEGPAYEAIQAQKRWMSLSVSNPLQRALELYITAGHYRSHIRRVSRVCKERRDAMLEAMKRDLPSDVTWSVPKGGLYVWVRLPEGVSGNEMYRLAGEEGVSVSPGSLFFVTGDHQPFIRLNFALHEPDVLREGIRRLGQAINRGAQQHRRIYSAQQQYHRSVSV